MAESTWVGGFGFSEAQEMYRRAVQEFAQRELAPAAKKRNKKELASAEELKGIMKKLYDSGLFGMELPEKFGGHPSDWTTYAIAVEELTKVDLLIGFVWWMSMVNTLSVMEVQEEVRAEWSLPVVKGEKVVCFASTEPGIGSDVAAIQTRAIRDEDYYILNGEKTSISLGMQADLCIIFAKTEPTAGSRGVSCFLVPLDLPGVSRSHYPDLGYKQIGRASITLDDVRIPGRYLVGEENKGFYVAMRAFDLFRLFLAVQDLALAQVSLDEAIAYAKERTAFGRPIARFEAISFKIAEHLTLIEAGRLLCYRAFWLADQGLRHTKETAMVKWFCPKIAVDAIHDVLLIHGHVGYSEEYSIEERLRDAIGNEIADGTAEVQKLIIAREVFGKEFRPY